MPGVADFNGVFSKKWDLELCSKSHFSLLKKIFYKAKILCPLVLGFSKVIRNFYYSFIGRRYYYPDIIQSFLSTIAARCAAIIFAASPVILSAYCFVELSGMKSFLTGFSLGSGRALKKSSADTSVYLS